MAERIAVAMSGGVDSSVAAALLHDQGFEVLGVTLQLWGKDVCTTAGTRRCCSVRDALDAKAVAKRLGIHHTVLELSEQFRTQVIDYFVDSYADGLTPNPCVVCNDQIKFGTLMEQAQQLGADLVATGHYARNGYDPATSRYTLSRAVDLAKDQSYVLFNLTQDQLSRARFPLGSLTKPDVRALARELGLATAEKPDSQDICFVRDGDKNAFLRQRLVQVEQPGPIIDTDGRVLGQHHGLLGYTIGQRQGLGIAAGYPLYVVAMDRTNNRLVVGSREQLLAEAFVAERVNWVSCPMPDQPRRADVKIRSRHDPTAATVSPLDANSWHVRFEVSQPAVTPGQAAVFYQDQLVLGGGWITVAPDRQDADRFTACKTASG